MEKFTQEERVEIVKLYYENGRSATATLRALRAKFPRNHVPSEVTVRMVIKKFDETGSVSDLPKSGRPKTARTDANVEKVRASVEDEPGTSIRRRSQELGISRTSLQKILTENLHLRPYKVQLTHKLEQTDHPERAAFAEWIQSRAAQDPQFCEKIIFSDEAHFHLGGYVNKQNCRIWGSENPQEVVQQGLYRPRVTVWCGLWKNGVIGPFFFENNEKKAVTVNGDRYRDMLRDFLWPRLQDIDISEVYFQQDGATCHTATETMDLLKTKFGDHVISRRGPVNWPPRSCDLTPLDFFLWGYLKDKVYANTPKTTEDLKINIINEINAIKGEILTSVIQNFEARILLCQRSLGEHMPDVIFHQ